MISDIEKSHHYQRPPKALDDFLQTLNSEGAESCPRVLSTSLFLVYHTGKIISLHIG